MIQYQNGEKDFLKTTSEVVTKRGSSPIARFNIDKITAKIGETITFTENSLYNPSNWEWDFGDGKKSNLRYANHFFNASGNYVVTLTVSNSFGSNSKTYNVEITNQTVVNEITTIAEFDLIKTTIFVDETVTLNCNSMSNTESCLWDFGDGVTSKLKNTTHKFNSIGTYIITLTISNDFTSNSKTRTITVINKQNRVDNQTVNEKNKIDNNVSTTTEKKELIPNKINENVIGEIVDIEGNSYKTIKIGTQIWMAENLRTKMNNDNTELQYIFNNIEWSDIKIPAFCNYNNTSNVDSIKTYGRLYNWLAVKNKKICPKAWHVPTDADWKKLAVFIDDDANKLKEIGTKHWLLQNKDANNITGFTALPSGFRGSNGSFSNIGNNGYWWSSTEYSETNAFRWCLRNNDNSLEQNYFMKNNGLSIRCIKN